MPDIWLLDIRSTYLHTEGPLLPGILPYLRRHREVSPHRALRCVYNSPYSCAFLTASLEHTDPGSRANPAKPNLLTADAKIHNISPYLGTEISGVQISQLSKEGLDELALLTAQRKVVIFRDQDFKDIGVERQIEIARYGESDAPQRPPRSLTKALYRHYGPIQIHPTSGNAKGHPEFHVGESSRKYSQNSNRLPPPIMISLSRR